MAAAYACIDRTLEPATARQLYVPDVGFKYFIMSMGDPSSSLETASSARSMPLTLVIATRPPACLGNHSIVRKFLATSFFLQSPYIVTNNGSKRTLPGSEFFAGCFGVVPAGYGT